MERETGIEPATNSLEGCDSTTELLPQTQLENWQVGELTNCCQETAFIHQFAKSPSLQLSPSARLVAREGFEPSKPLGRQIYSLLRLTASLPRPAICSWNALFPTTLKTAWRSINGAGGGI